MLSASKCTPFLDKPFEMVSSILLGQYTVILSVSGLERNGNCCNFTEGFVHFSRV